MIKNRGGLEQQKALLKGLIDIGVSNKQTANKQRNKETKTEEYI